MEKTIINSFIKKHGENTFNEIKKLIYDETSQNKESYGEEYITYIFEIATYKYCGIEDEKIPTVISKMGNTFIPQIPYNKLIKTHQNSINEIIKFLDKSVENI